MGRLIFINRYFYPDESATSQMLTDLAFALAEGGYEIRIITSRQRIDDPRANLLPREACSDVMVFRVWTSRWGRTNLPGRAMDYLSFYFSSAVRLFRVAGKGDVIIAKTDPPLIGVIAGLVARLKGASLINWWQDVYPEIAEELGVIGAGAMSRSLRSLRNSACRMAKTNIVIGRCMQENLVNFGVSPAHISVIPNWADDREIQPMSATDNPLRDDWELANSFVVGYSGNLGRGHDFDVLLEAASVLSDDPVIRFLFIGSGANKNAVVARVGEMGLSNVVFKPFQPRTRLNVSLTIPDVHIITLKPELSGLIVPSKIYGALAAGRPVLFIGPADSEIALVIRDYDCGFVCDDAGAEEIARIIRLLRDDRGLCDRLGHNARLAVDDRYSREHALRIWGETLDAAMS